MTIRHLFLLGLFAAMTMTYAASAKAENAMSPTEFIKAYEKALGTQSWDEVSPLIHDQASVTFSNGAVHKGKDAVRSAYEANFEAIKNEAYKISNVHWVAETTESAVYMFDFHWTGTLHDKTVSGAGRGTAVLVFDQGKWQLIAEHLGPYPKTP